MHSGSKTKEREVEGKKQHSIEDGFLIRHEVLKQQKQNVPKRRADD